MLADAVVTHDATSHLPSYIVAPTLPLRQSQKKADSSEFGVVREFVYVCCCWGFVGDDSSAKADVSSERRRDSLLLGGTCLAVV